MSRRIKKDQQDTTMAGAPFPSSTSDALERFADFMGKIVAASDSRDFDAYMDTQGIKFVPYLGEFNNGNIEPALSVMAAGLVEALMSSIPEGEDDHALMALRVQLAAASQWDSMWTSNGVLSEQQFSAIEPILEKTYSNTPDQNAALAKSILTGISSNITYKAMVQTLANNRSFIDFALYFALDVQTEDEDTHERYDINIAPVNWARARMGRLLPLTMLTKGKDEMAFPGKVDGHAGSSMFTFSIALALYIGVATFKAPEDRTPQLMDKIKAQKEEISQLRETPEAVEAARMRVVGEQLEGMESMCWLWAMFTGACNSMVPPPAGYLASIESFNQGGTYSGGIQYGYAVNPMISNPLTDILRNAPQDTNARITAFMAEFNGIEGSIAPWRAMALGISEDDGRVIMKDFRAVHRQVFGGTEGDSIEGIAASANGYVCDSDGDIWARRTMIVTLSLSEDEVLDGSNIFRAQLGSLCIIAALGRALNCISHVDLLTDSTEDTGSIVDTTEPDTLRLMRAILGLSMVSPDIEGPFRTEDGERVGFRYVLSLPVLVDNEIKDRIEAFVKPIVENFMHIGGDCIVEDIHPRQIGLSFAPLYTTCIGRNLVPTLTRMAVSIVHSDNPLMGTADNRGDIEERLMHMIELTQDQTNEVMGALRDSGTEVFADRLLLNAGPGFFHPAFNETDIREFAMALFMRISMQQPADTPPVRPPIQPFAPVVYAPSDALAAADQAAPWIMNTSLPFEDDDQNMQTFD